METTDQVISYHVNVAAYLKLGEWFDYLRKEGVYDNTRIIVVSDHGRQTNQFGIYCADYDMQNFMPILFVKDFNAKGFSVSDDFMTNADTPSLATSGIINNPTNPFTGNPINMDPKNGPQKVFYCGYWSVALNNGNTFLPGAWYSIKGDPHIAKNWKFIGDY